jgi:hypothetical protein
LPWAPVDAAIVTRSDRYARPRLSKRKRDNVRRPVATFSRSRIPAAAFNVAQLGVATGPWPQPALPVGIVQCRLLVSLPVARCRRKRLDVAQVSW